ncbi:hypothetical protein L1987_19064 [Smallanthus sonchifolius]|uniref:Uncharacterized protein n=1 Tax=Smallanthus sonchifolius TaxID=185202 RepID=A0ACB9J1G4_9ASTR|nr:hypothetical protein L1987_19064 [Smallanthus sonchifolius]
MGTRLNFSTAYHPQTDCQSERTIQTLEDMLRACIIDFGGSWDSHLPLAEFSYNNSHHTTIGMPPYEMLYGRRCRTPVCWGEIGQKELGSLEVVRETSERIMAWVGEVAYRLELPDELSGIHPTFHVSHLRKCLADESAHIQLTDIEVHNSLNYIEEPVAILDRKEKRLRNKIIQLIKGFCDEAVRAYLSSTHEADLAYLPSTQEEDRMKQIGSDVVGPLFRTTQISLSGAFVASQLLYNWGDDGYQGDYHDP